MQLDRIDRKILDLMMRDATLPVAQIAEVVGLSQTPAWKRLQKLEATGVITGRVALVDPAKIGLGLIVFMGVEAADHSVEWRETFRATIEDFPQITEVYRMAGAVDYLLKLVLPDTAAFDRFYLEFTTRLPCRNITSSFAMETLRHRSGWPINVTTA
ncbi:Lrp/AsnC family transcriptional regulator (plasmid) [Thioclava sp. 'Guangxiensis']|uniref:Lrp/AsnC family transcriptional regulator n=1 Tax=Thioclava sp. 'Guangxiensis' TaxID=3149044 RepID=UPI0032C3E5FE